MKVRCASRSCTGPVRENNEDSIAEWMPTTDEERRARGTVLLIADGIGGQSGGEIASSLAIEHALLDFLSASTDLSPTQALRRMFDAANLAVYDAAARDEKHRYMGTTLTVTVLLNNEITVGHVGDCRVYLFQEGRLRRITNDHSYAGVQLKLGLITVEEAKASEHRSVLTRSVGKDPMIRADFHRLTLQAGDRLLQCTDGVYCAISEGEIAEMLRKLSPEEACEELISLAERRGSDDNMSVQVAHVEQLIGNRFDSQGQVAQSSSSDNTMGSELEVGQVLDGRYEATELIARSGMAQIFRAVDQVTERTVALKVPLMQYESDPSFFSRFEREEKIGRALSHPYILRIEAIDTPKSRPYIVMELLEGQTLAHLMRSVRPLPEADANRIAGYVCDALHYMHEHGVIHRDLKPDNVMICNDGTIRIMDFGIAKFEGQRRLTFGGFTPAMGTPDYMAPEQVKGKRGDVRTDIYSLGAILYEMVTGAMPFDGSNPFLIMNARLTGDPVAPRIRNADVSPQVEEIILHAMERDPAARYQSAIDMQADLKNPQAVDVTGRADRVVEPQPWQSRWRRGRVMLACVGIPILAFALIWVFTHVKIGLK